MALGLLEVINKVRSDIHAITGLPVSSTLGIVREEEKCQVTLELLEKKSIPDSMDILATYEVESDDDGNIIEFRRTGMRKRGDTDEA